MEIVYYKVPTGAEVSQPFPADYSGASHFYVPAHDTLISVMGVQFKIVEDKVMLGVARGIHEGRLPPWLNSVKWMHFPDSLITSLLRAAGEEQSRAQATVSSASPSIDQKVKALVAAGKRFS